MAEINLQKLTLVEAKQKLLGKEFSVRELTESYLKRIGEKNADWNVYLEVFDDALAQAKILDEKLSRGDTSGALHGLPLAFKDNILIEGKIASAASKILGNYVASYDATATAKLKNEGALILGRVNMDEFAMGVSTEHSAYGATKNPRDPSRVPGGSSGGSAAAVAGDLALASLGSDTAGSIRQPASFCGVVGFKPTYGRVSRHGLIALTSSLDCIGPITKTVADAEMIYDVIKGADQLDSTSARGDENLPAKKGPYKIGVPYKFLTAGVAESVKNNFEASLKKLKDLGHEIVEIDLPSFKYAVPCYYVITPAEASTNLARFDGMRYGARLAGKDLWEEYAATRVAGFGTEPKRRIMVGAYVLSSGYYDAYYRKAVEVKELVRREVVEVFKTVDLIATPTTPAPAFKPGEKVNDPIQMYLEDIFTVPANLAGTPAISVPSGVDENNLPLGLQFMAPHWQEASLFNIGKQFYDEQLWAKLFKSWIFFQSYLFFNS